MTKIADDKSDAYISIVAAKTPKPDTFWGWHYEIWLEQFGKVKEMWGTYERGLGAKLVPHFTNGVLKRAPIIPMELIDEYRES